MAGPDRAQQIVAHETLQVAQQRVPAVLGRITPEGGSDMIADLAVALDEVGL